MGPDVHDGALRITMTLPGSASLGAFQAGATAALAEVVEALQQAGTEVRVDAVGGASAGSIVAMMFAHCLLTGRDAARMLRTAWVDEVDARLLRSGDGRAPLAFDDLRNRMTSFLEDRERFPFDDRGPIDGPVSVQVGLTSLLGFTIPVRTAGDEMTSLSFADWVGFELERGHDPSALSEPAGAALLDAVLVSASHPAAFAPRALDRTQDRTLFEERGVTNLPDAGRLWYTDGGLVESRPIARIIRAARDRAGAAAGTRLHIVVDPRSSGPSGTTQWVDPDGAHSWIDGLRRAVSILPTQALHDDLRGIAVVNERLERLDALVDELAPALEGRLDRDELRSRLAELGDLGGKERVDVESITPRLEARDSDRGVSDLLAGDFIGAFGGFLDSSLRRSDFALGWQSTRSWVPDGLRRHGLDAVVIDDVASRLDTVAHDVGDDVVLREESSEHLGFGGRWELAMLALQIGRIVVGHAVPSLPRWARRRRRS